MSAGIPTSKRILKAQFMRSTRSHHLLAAVLALTMLPGCHSARQLVRRPSAPVPVATAENPIIESICIWEPSEGIGLDEKPTRGFAGKLMFFTAANAEPVQVNGDVKIYLFDDHGTVEEQSKPIHQFEFPQQVFQKYMTQTDLGVAYQLFIPYTRKSPYAADCAIRVKVQPENGRPVYSKMAAVVLDGPQSPEMMAAARRQAIIQQASYETAAKERPPQQAPTPEQAAAYFGAAALPKPAPSNSADLQRLKAALSSTQPTPQNPSRPRPAAGRHQSPLSSQHHPQQHHPQLHPLLDD